MNTHANEGNGDTSERHPSLSLVEARRELRQSLAALRAVDPDRALDSVGLAGEAVDALSSVLTAADSLLDASLLLGECQVEVPFAPLRPVITSDGEFRWCCSHPTQHCARPGG